MVVKVQVIGLKEATKKMLVVAGNIDKGMENGMKKVAPFLQGEVKQSIAGHRPEQRSVDTGRFLNSVDFEISKAQAAIFSNVPYAKFLEWGTTRIRPRRHFNNSLARSKQKITQLLGQEIKNVVK